MSNLKGKDLAQFAISKIGTPYAYGAKGADGVFTQSKLDWLARNYPNMYTANYISKAKKLVGKVCSDCSGLISWYTGKLLGSSQLYSTAAQRGLIKDIDKAPIGAVLWKNGHVGVYIGNGYCMEEKGIDYGCVKSKVSNTHFTHWLTFSYIDYTEITENIKARAKNNNPYAEPINSLSKGDVSEYVKWLQFELVEAGYKLKLDGDFGINTDKAVRSFQQSCKITVDGVVGEVTRKCLKNN